MKLKDKLEICLVTTFFSATFLYITLVIVLYLGRIITTFDNKFNGIEYPDTEMAKTKKDVRNDKRNRIGD